MMLAGAIKRYLRYRASGVEWLGKIPAHWQVNRLKFVAPIRSSKVASAPTGQTFVGLENIEPHTGRLLLNATPLEPESVVGWFAAGDVLIGKLRPYLAKVVRPAFAGISTTELVALQPAACSQGFLFYTLLNTSFTRCLNSLTFGSKMPRASPEQIANTFVPVPPEDEQQAIVAFLDRETAKVDTLIEQKEKLINLLNEQRMATISHAIVQSRNAGRTTKLKYVAKFVYGDTLPPLDGREGCTVVFGSNGPFALTSVSNTLAPAIVVGRKGSYGKVNWSSEECFASDTTFFVDSRTCRHDLRWLFWLLQTLHLDEGTDEAAVPGLRLQLAYGRDVVVPPRTEQRAIAAVLDREAARIDSLLVKVRAAIERLKEYRLALISAAVTGNIDVRGEAAH